MSGRDGATGLPTGGRAAGTARGPQREGTASPLVQLCFLVFPLLKLTGYLNGGSEEVFHV